MGSGGRDSADRDSLDVTVEPRLPLAIRLHLGALRAALLLERLARELLDAVAWSWTPPARRDEVTSAIYARQPTYVRGGEAFERGLFAWEREALARPEWPRSGRVLLGGAGGGRELLALAARGYVVRAFEPLPRFAEACAKECRTAPGSSCLAGSYADLVEAARDGRGPLSALVAEAPFDAVLLGWGSLAHVTEPGRVDEVLAAARALAPNGPIFTSYYTRDGVGAPPGRMGRLGRALERLFAAAGAPGRRPDGAVFHPSAGFVRTSTAEEVTALAARHGCEVAAITTSGPQPWALLVPTSAPRRAGPG
jgi:hypothetical protein